MDELKIKKVTIEYKDGTIVEAPKRYVVNPVSIIQDGGTVDFVNLDIPECDTMIKHNQTGVCPDNFTITCDLCGSTECDIEYYEGEGIFITCYNCDNYFSED